MEGVVASLIVVSWRVVVHGVVLVEFSPCNSRYSGLQLWFQIEFFADASLRVIIFKDERDCLVQVLLLLNLQLSLTLLRPYPPLHHPTFYRHRGTHPSLMTDFPNLRTYFARTIM